MLKSIYASQFYKYSKNRKGITAALADPQNQGLVLQLAEALDDEYQQPEYLLDKEDQTTLEEGPTPETELEEPEDNDMPLEDEPKVSESDNLKKLDSKSSSVPKGPKSEVPTPDAPKPSSDTESESEPKSEPQKVKESTTVEPKGTQEKVFATSRSYFTDFHQLCDQIKGLLNLTSATAGVSRVMVKGDELQIFYDDSINLNNIMGEVLEILNGAGYTYLDFNRLMRSSNAIVLVINAKDTNNQVKPMNFAEGTTE